MPKNGNGRDGGPRVQTSKTEAPASAPNVVLPLAKAVTHHLGGQAEEALRELENAGANTPEVLAARGYLQLELGRFKEAFESYAKALEQKPNDASLSFHAGLALQNLGRAADALPHFERALEAQPEWLEAKVSIGICRLHLKKCAEAIEVFDECLQRDQTCQPALFGKAVSLHLLWRFDEARQCYISLLELNANSEETLINLISLGLQTKNYDLVRSHAELLMKLKQDHTIGLESLAAVAFAKNDLDAARDLCVRLTQVAPQVYDNWFNLGLAQQKLGNINDAIQAYVRARTIRADVAWAHVQLGTVYQEMGDLSSARESFEQALRLTPERTDLQYQLAWIREQQGDLGAAETLYHKIVEKNPDMPDAYFRLGYLRLKRQEFGTSAEAFRSCLDKRPDWREAELNLAMAYWKTKDYDGAREVLSNILRRESDCMDALRGLAAIALDCERDQEALEFHLRLQDLGEKTPVVLYNSGLLAHKLGRREDAAGYYRAALDQLPEFPEALLNIGHVLKEMGREDQARTYWALAIEAKPELAAGYFHA